jgi:hypothetical protein
MSAAVMNTNMIINTNSITSTTMNIIMNIIMNTVAIVNYGSSLPR